MRPIFLLLLAIASAVPVERADASDKADSARCRNFVVAMRKLAAKEAANTCGFWGKFSETGTFSWCLKEKKDAVDAAETKNGEMISMCEKCRAYADAAATAAVDNKLFHCGFSGPRWDPDPQAHFNHCMARWAEASATSGIVNWFTPGAPLPAFTPVSLPNKKAQDEAAMHLVGETSAREDDIKACKATVRERFSKDELTKCDDYAKRAVEDAKFNQTNKCGAGPAGRWSTNTEDHFMWCLPKIGDANGRKDIESEQATRTQRVEVCKLEVNAGRPKQEVDSAMAKKKTKQLGKQETGSGGRSMAGAPLPKQEGKGGKSMVKQDGGGSSVGGATTRRADPKLKANNASGGAYRSQNNPSGGSGGANRAMNSGLLDGDSGFAAAGPTGTGSGGGGAAGGGAAGGGGSAGGGIARTYGAPPGMSSFGASSGGAFRAPR